MSVVVAVLGSLAFFIYLGYLLKRKNQIEIQDLLDEEKPEDSKPRFSLRAGAKETRKILRLLGISSACIGFYILSYGFPGLALPSLLVGYLLYSKNKDEDFSIDDKTIYTYLPITLQKLIMLVEAGNDLMQALKKLTFEADRKNVLLTIFSEIVEKFEGGLTIEEAIQFVKNKYQNLTLNFVLTYLNISIKEGGQIIPQLQELSDTVLQSYEAYIEGQVNKMPVKALLPLLVMFAGVFLILASSPAAYLIDYFEQINFERSFSF